MAGTAQQASTGIRRFLESIHGGSVHSKAMSYFEDLERKIGERGARSVLDQVQHANPDIDPTSPGFAALAERTVGQKLKQLSEAAGKPISLDDVAESLGMGVKRATPEVGSAMAKTGQQLPAEAMSGMETGTEPGAYGMAKKVFEAEPVNDLPPGPKAGGGAEGPTMEAQWRPADTAKAAGRKPLELEPPTGGMSQEAASTTAGGRGGLAKAAGIAAATGAVAGMAGGGGAPSEGEPLPPAQTVFNDIKTSGPSEKKEENKKPPMLDERPRPYRARPFVSEAAQVKPEAYGVTREGAPHYQERTSLDTEYENARQAQKEELNQAAAAYKTERDDVKRRQLWEKISHAVGYLVAGWYGQKQQIPLNVQFDRSDWPAEMRAADDAYRNAMAAAQAKYSAHKEELEAKGKTIDAHNAKIDREFDNNFKLFKAAYDMAADRDRTWLNAQAQAAEQYNKGQALNLQYREILSKEKYYDDLAKAAGDKAEAKIAKDEAAKAKKDATTWLQLNAKLTDAGRARTGQEETDRLREVWELNSQLPAEYQLDPAWRKLDAADLSAAIAKPRTPATGPYGDRVTQDGVTYTWNPKTKQYE